jgi:hypothetical protein
MKTGFLFMALTIGLLTAGWAGNVLAGDRVANVADPEAMPNLAWTAQGPIETGALPDMSSSSSEGDRVVSGDTAFPQTDVGGVRYRLGIDTGA